MEILFKLIQYVVPKARKKLLAGLAVVACAGSAVAQISLVHVTSCGTGAFPGTTCTIPATASGDLLVVGWDMISPASGPAISSISDNAGNTYAEAGSAKASYSLASLDIWYSKNIAAGTTTITITPTASVTTAGAVVWEFSGASSSSPLDVTGVLSNQAATATPVSPTLTTSSANEVIVAIADVDNSVTGIASGNAFTEDPSVFSNGFAHLLTSSAGSYFAQWNQSSSGTYASSAVAFKAGTTTTTTGTQTFSACDLNQDGVVNGTDVTLAVNMALGTTACTANVEGADICTVITVQRVVNASLGQACITYNGHGAVVTWTASSSSGLAGYNVYRATSSSGPFTKLNSALITATTYTDSAVQAGQIYYYAVTAMNTSGQESTYSTTVSATIPIP